VQPTKKFAFFQFLKEALKNDEIQGGKRFANEAYWQYDEKQSVQPTQKFAFFRAS